MVHHYIRVHGNGPLTLALPAAARGPPGGHRGGGGERGGGREGRQRPRGPARERLAKPIIYSAPYNGGPLNGAPLNGAPTCTAHNSMVHP